MSEINKFEYYPSPGILSAEAQTKLLKRFAPFGLTDHDAEFFVFNLENARRFIPKKAQIPFGGGKIKIEEYLNRLIAGENGEDGQSLE